MADLSASVYVVADTVLIPTHAQTDAGFSIETEPVEVLKSPGVEELSAGIERVFLRGNPSVRTPMRGAFPKPVLLNYVKARSWADFAKRARLWVLVRSGEKVVIIPTIRSAEGGFLHRPELQDEVDSADTVEIAQRLLALIDAVR